MRAGLLDTAVDRVREPVLRRTARSGSGASSLSLTGPGDSRPAAAEAHRQVRVTVPPAGWHCDDMHKVHSKLALDAAVTPRQLTAQRAGQAGSADLARCASPGSG